MPVSGEVAESNRSQTERLRALAVRLTPEGLALRLPNGWTVAVALAHVAFWDRQRLCLMRRWAAGEDQHTGAYDGEVFSDTLLPFLEAIPHDRAVRLAIEAAEEVDAFLLAVPDAVIASAMARPAPPTLDRGMHRGYHLDQIDRALADAGLA